MATGPIGVGIIGSGSIARAHLRAYQAWPDRCRIVATADIVPERAAELARLAGAEAWYGDYRALLERPDVHLVSVCTPPFAHAAASPLSRPASMFSARSRWPPRWRSVTR